MKLREIVVDKAIVPNLVATKLEDAVHELLDALVESGRVSPDMRDTFAKSILAREKKGSTGLNHGVAIPHTKTTAVKSPLAAVGISRTTGLLDLLDALAGRESDTARRCDEGDFHATFEGSVPPILASSNDR